MVIQVTVTQYRGDSVRGMKIQSSDQKIFAHVLSLDHPLSSNDIKIGESTLLYEIRDLNELLKDLQL